MCLNERKFAFLKGDAEKVKHEFRSKIKNRYASYFSLWGLAR
jgi:hypothetical protein